MTDTIADFVIVGSTPLARLIAGLLASVHDKTVVFSGESQAAFRLPRGLDLSVGGFTRPERWALLKHNVPATLKLLSKVAGRGSWSRVDPILFSETAAGDDALDHVRHMAQAFGHAAERVPQVSIGTGRRGVLFRDAAVLHRSVVEAKLDAWLERLILRRQSADDTLTVMADGSAELVGPKGRTTVGQTVLADDAAILAHLLPEQWPALLTRQITSTIFTEPTRPVAAPVMHQLDSGMTLWQRHADRGIAAMGPGAIDPFGTALGVLLGQERAFRQAGQSSYETLITRDGAPAVGRVAGSGCDIIAGFGMTGAFFAPSLARWLSGKAGPDENSWLGAHLVDRAMKPSSVAEFMVLS